MTRYGSIIGLQSDKVDEYKRLHAAVWPAVLEMIEECHIHNYSIYLHKLDDSRSNTPSNASGFTSASAIISS
jgi:L-rhamnose mutarotase